MHNNDVNILIIHTSDSSSIFVSKDFFPYDAPDLKKICYSITEGNNPLYWLDGWHSDINKIINILEFRNQCVSGKRDYISWWHNCKPYFIDDSIKSILRNRLLKYHLTGEIKTTFKNSNFGL